MKSVFTSVSLVLCLVLGGCFGDFGAWDYGEPETYEVVPHLKVESVWVEGSVGDVRDIEVGSTAEVLNDYELVTTSVPLRDKASNADGMVVVSLGGDFSSLEMGKEYTYTSSNWADDVFLGVLGCSNEEAAVREEPGQGAFDAPPADWYDWDVEAEEVVYTVQPGEFEGELLVEFVAHFEDIDGRPRTTTKGSVAITMNAAHQF